MPAHPHSVVEFGLFLNRVSESLLDGLPLQQSAELIRVQLAASAVAIQIDHRLVPARSLLAIVETPAQPKPDADAPPAGDSARLSTLLKEQHHIAASVLGEADGVRYTLTVFRDHQQREFDAEDVAVCEILVSQLRRSAELSSRMGVSETERALYSSVMDRLAVGVVLLDLDGRIVKSSAAASEALAARDGLQIQAGRVRALSTKEDRDLQQAIKAAIQGVTSGTAPAMRGLSLTGSTGSRNLGVIVQPIPGCRGTGQAGSAAVAIYIRDSGATAEVEGELVRQLFDLTPAEAAVARRLASGLSLEDAASSLDISRNTARAHLRSIFSKRGITRQTELIRMMLNSAVVLGAGAAAGPDPGHLAA